MGYNAGRTTHRLSTVRSASHPDSARTTALAKSYPPGAPQSARRLFTATALRRPSQARLPPALVMLPSSTPPDCASRSKTTSHLASRSDNAGTPLATYRNSTRPTHHRRSLVPPRRLATTHRLSARVTPPDTAPHQPRPSRRTRVATTHPTHQAVPSSTSHRYASDYAQRHTTRPNVTTRPLRQPDASLRRHRATHPTTHRSSLTPAQLRHPPPRHSRRRRAALITQAIARDHASRPDHRDATSLTSPPIVSLVRPLANATRRRFATRLHHDALDGATRHGSSCPIHPFTTHSFRLRGASTSDISCQARTRRTA